MKGRQIDLICLVWRPIQTSSGSCPARNLMFRFSYLGVQPQHWAFAVPSQVNQSMKMLIHAHKFFESPPIIKWSLIPTLIYF